jgi:pimeloyl-ACP methyl ester carboxylesterase
MNLPSLFLSAAVLLLLPGCINYSKVKEVKPRTVIAATGITDPAMLQGARELEKRPLVALGHFLAAAESAEARLHRSPADAAAQVAYNAAVSEVFSAIRHSGVNVWTGPLAVAGPAGTYTLTAQIDPRYPERHPQLYDYVPAANLEISGLYMKERTVKPGLGAALVAVRREERKDARERFTLPRSYYGVTAVARFSGRRCVVEFLDPLSSETVRLGTRTYPLAADFTAPFALLLDATHPEKLEILNLFRPGEPADSARIARLQPFDPDKTTVLVVHGLGSSPATWAPMLAALRGDAEIRKRYQFWFYEYPSGYPYPYSAAIMRRELNAALKTFPQKKPMIFIGHSMGGIISRLMITDSGDHLWRQLYGRHPDTLRMPQESRSALTESLIFKSRPEAGRVIFIATPHRGSETAEIWPVRLVAKLIRLPQNVVTAGMATLRTVVTGPENRAGSHAPTSLDTLSPNNPFVKAVNEIPVRRGVPYHSIMGDRGRGDTPNSSDGVVPYWSSHTDGAVSEKIVPSGHSAHQHPEAIAEVLRILKSAGDR